MPLCEGSYNSGSILGVHDFWKDSPTWLFMQIGGGVLQKESRACLKGFEVNIRRGCFHKLGVGPLESGVGLLSRSLG